MANGPAISIRGLRTAFGTKVIHDALDLDVRRGEVLAIVGGSGSGKSVLLREIIGLIEPVEGEIQLFGRNQRKMSPHDQRQQRLRIGVLFQDGALFSSLTVSQNIQVPIRNSLKLPDHLLEEIAGVKLALAGLPPMPGPNIRANFRAACASERVSHGHWRWIRNCFFSTSRRPVSILSARMISTC